VVLTGDVHSNWVSNLHQDFRDPGSAPIGTEFVVTSISSGGDGADAFEGAAVILSENPHLKYHDAQRGYVRCDVTPDGWLSDYRVVPYVTRPDAPVETRRSFLVEQGRPGAQNA
jgi:alkaline phosphatase D